MHALQKFLQSVETHIRSLCEEAGQSVAIKVQQHEWPRGPEMIAEIQGVSFTIVFLPVLQAGVLNTLGALPSIEGRIPLVVTRRLSASIVKEAQQLGICILDFEGNAHIRAPGLFIKSVADPRKERPAAAHPALFAPKASRLPRLMLSQAGKAWIQAELVEASDLSQGYISKCLQAMKAEGYARTSQEDGVEQFTLDEPDRLLDDWASHYRFGRHESRQFAMSFTNLEAGTKKLVGILAELGIKHALTGLAGAYLRAPLTIPDKLAAYVSDFPESDAGMGLFPVEQAGNIQLVVPQDAGVFHGNHMVSGLPCVGDVQLYLDLLKMSGRTREAAEELRSRFLQFGE